MRTTTIISALTAFLFSISGHAQTTIELTIEHTLNEEAFALFEESATPEGLSFNLDRTEYYLSSFSVTHDGGQVTAFDSVWALVNAAQPTSIYLGDADVTEVEAVSFSVGVEQAFNHLDPSSWPSNHPLAHKNPSMHWGWTSGYRFAAIEGKGGDNLNQVFEIHALGNQNYFDTEVEVTATAANGGVSIPIYANISAALKDIDMSSGLIEHGSTGKAVTLLENFSNHVFTSSAYQDTTIQEDPTGIALTNTNDQGFALLNNPSTDGNLQVLVSAEAVGQVVDVYSITGERLIQKRITNSGVTTVLEGADAGIYILSSRPSNGQVQFIQKAVVQ